MTDEKKIFAIGIATVITIITFWFATIYFLEDDTNRGTYGDMFGATNALFSGLALAGIIFTILLQRIELRYQREELIETRKEFITQNKTLKIQRFETTFFNLLSLHNQIVNDIDYDKEVTFTPPGSGFPIKSDYKKELRTVKGRDVFRDRFNNLNKRMKKDPNVEKVYLNFYEERKTDFAHYFRNLYRIIKIVHETEFITDKELNISESEYSNNYYLQNFKERYRYTSIVRAQLSDYELLILFYNCLTDHGNKKFKPLIEEYALLKNLPKHEIIEDYLIPYYEESAYKNKNEYDC